jgi:pimeloyl-ACP methyl ester carboxylesterase
VVDRAGATQRTAGDVGLGLVHGGLQGAWAWEGLIPHLAYLTIAVDLPGRDGDPAGFRAITYQDWIDAATAQVDTLPVERVVLVAHSLGGITVPAVAARLGARTAGMVFISAMIPPEGASAAATLGVDYIADDGGFHPGPPDLMRQQLGNDLTEEQTTRLLDRLVPDPFGPWTEPISRRDMPNVPRLYVRLARDLGLPPEMQEAMVANLGGATEVVLDAGHSVMFSRPAELAAVINEFTAGV